MELENFQNFICECDREQLLFFCINELLEEELLEIAIQTKYENQLNSFSDTLKWTEDEMKAVFKKELSLKPIKEIIHYIYTETPDLLIINKLIGLNSERRNTILENA